MRPLTQFQNLEYMIQQNYISERESILIKDVTDMSTEVVDNRVGDMLYNQQFKEHTQDVADFVDSIVDEICADLLSYFSDPTDYDYDTRRDMVEANIYREKAKAVGINVSMSEVDARMLTTSRG